MTKQLRRRHFLFWLILMPILPLGIISARLVRPHAAIENLVQPSSETALPILISSVSNEKFTVNLRKGDDTTQQLEWISKQALTVPTAVIYIAEKGSKSIEGAKLIGRIEARGTYRFPIPPGPVDQLLLYDFIHQQIIDTINF